MTNSTCPFCKKTIFNHQAGRCLDHWVEAVKNKYKEPFYSSRCYFYKEESRRKNEFVPFKAPNYSEDMNHAITLWGENWVVLKREDRWEVWNKYHFAMFMGLNDSKYKSIAHAETPALAVTKANLKTELEGIKE